MHTGGLTRSWSSAARPDVRFRSTKEKCKKLATSAEPGRDRENPGNKRFQQLLRMSPKISLSGPASHEQRAPRGRPVQACRHGCALLGQPPGSQLSRERGSPTPDSKAVPESGVRLLAAQKPIKRRSWWKGKLL